MCFFSAGLFDSRRVRSLTSVWLHGRQRRTLASVGFQIEQDPLNTSYRIVFGETQIISVCISASSFCPPFKPFSTRPDSPQTCLPLKLKISPTYLTPDQCQPYYFSHGGGYFNWKLMKFFYKSTATVIMCGLVRWWSGSSRARSKSSLHHVYILEWQMPQCGSSHRSTAGSCGMAVQHRGHGPCSLKSWNHGVLGFLCFKQDRVTRP